MPPLTGTPAGVLQTRSHDHTARGRGLFPHFTEEGCGSGGERFAGGLPPQKWQSCRWPLGLCSLREFVHRRWSSLGCWCDRYKDSRQCPGLRERPLEGRGANPSSAHFPGRGEGVPDSGPGEGQVRDQGPPGHLIQPPASIQGLAFAWIRAWPRSPTRS